ncbi:MAG: TPM domain-containing protein [Clostridia bacterium]
MKKLLCMMLMILLALASAAPALAAARMPANRGTLTDDADVLNAQTAADIATYAVRVGDETDIRLHVAIVHFLDGLDANTYATRLFEAWGLDDMDMLLLGAAGEDTFATAMGAGVEQKLGRKNAENLMFTSSAFSELFRKQQYDAAFGKYFIALNTLLNKQYNANIKLGKLFESAQSPTQAAQPVTDVRTFGSQLWDEVMTSIQDSTDNYQTYHETRKHESNGMNAGGWIVLLIIIAILFGNSDPARRSRKQGRASDMGCGCGPLSWIVWALGLNVFFNRRRRN